MKLAVDAVIVRGGKVLLVKRKAAPFKGFWALPGGMVKRGETAAGAVVREAKEETGLSVKIKRVIGVFDAPGRDPRGRVVSVAFSCAGRGTEVSGSDAACVSWFPLQALPKLAFDHGQIIARRALRQSR